MRRFILLLAGMASIGLLGILGTGGGLIGEDQGVDAQSVSRPNFVFVLTDDLDERSMQDLPGITNVMGANGITFENAYVTYSLCCPSRATILRGQYPHNHSIIGNSLPEGGEAKFRDLRRDESTIATWLDDVGYQTKFIGKYMNSYYDLYKPPGWDEWYALKQGNGPYEAVNEDGHWTTLGGHSAYVFADKTSDFIRRSSVKPDPFFVMVNTIAPHNPPEVAARYQDEFATTPLPQQGNFNEAEVSDKPAWVRSRNPHSQSAIDNMEREYRDRLRSMLSVEDLLKQVIATLEETDELKSTYIFFTSDNGYHLGNHRLGPGKRAPYEEDIGVPLMVRGPGVPAAAVRQQLVLNNDFAPTIAALAGAPTPPFVDGSSFAPLLTDSPPSSWRTAFLEEGWLGSSSGAIPPTHKSVHTKSHMFTEYDTGEYELYDLVQDPYQLQSKSRAGNEQLYSDLQTRLDALRDCSGAGTSTASCRAAEGFPGTTPPPPPPADTSGPPKVVSTLPTAKATGVSPTATITATFSEDMLPSSINGKTFKLFRKGSTTKIAAAIGYDAATDTATLDPTGSLPTGITYKAVVTTGAKDSAGNSLDQDSTTTGLQQYVWLLTVSN